MLIQVLKSKLKDVIVTSANTEYEGSITLDPELMDAAGFHPNEAVHVNTIDGESRIITYVIPGERGSGQVELNGGAANYFHGGDHIHVNCFWYVDDTVYESEGKKIYAYNPAIIVKTDENNKVI